jgi:hypothetical protein
VSDEATPVGKTVPADEQLARELVERARSEGPGGLLTDLTKTVLERAVQRTCLASAASGLFLSRACPRQCGLCCCLN